MHTATLHTEPASRPPMPVTAPTPVGSRSVPRSDAGAVCARVNESLKLLGESVEVQRRIVHAGDTVFQGGQAFQCLYIINSGFFKTLNVAADGREQVVGLHFKGDWMGFDGIAHSQYGCDAIAMDTGEVWSVRYDALLVAASRQPALLGMLHAAMSREISRDRDSLLSLGTLPADARVADFLRYWAESLSERGLRADQITLRMTRAEIGNYLGMTLESVSRALSRMARSNVIRFTEKGRRDLCIASTEALASFIQAAMTPQSRVLQ
jgi:CRP/FNR family transcriptional regulator